MKKQRFVIILIAVIAVIALCMSVFAAADTAKPVQLVTLDYIENTLLPDIEEKIATGSVQALRESILSLEAAIDYLNTEAANAKNTDASLQKQITALSETLSALTARVEALENAAYPNGFVRVTVLAGQTLSITGNEDDTVELVLISGTLTVRDVGGMFDLTSGSHLAHGSAVPLCHHMVATIGTDASVAYAEEDTTILVKGEYEIV